MIRRMDLYVHETVTLNAGISYVNKFSSQLKPITAMETQELLRSVNDIVNDIRDYLLPITLTAISSKLNLPYGTIMCIEH